jgi:hypothetical protein
MYSSARLLKITAIACCLGCLPAVTWAADPNPALAAQQRIDKRKQVFDNGTTREVHYDLNGLPPDRAILYQRLETLENQVSDLKEAQRLNATYLRNEQKVEGARMASVMWDFSGRNTWRYRPATGSAALLQPNYSTGMTTTSSLASEALNAIMLMNSAKQDLLQAEQDAARGVAPLQGAATRPPVPNPAAPANPAPNAVAAVKPAPAVVPANPVPNVAAPANPNAVDPMLNAINLLNAANPFKPVLNAVAAKPEVNRPVVSGAAAVQSAPVAAPAAKDTDSSKTNVEVAIGAASFALALVMFRKVF